MLKLFNSLTQKKELFAPLKDQEVSLYVCGITPYDTTHLGHAFTYISFDVLVRVLTYSGLKVKYTQNVTDINDRDKDILERAKQQNIAWEDLSDFWTKKFLDDMSKLNWIMPENYLYASDEIPSMIELTQKLIDNNLGYVVNGAVYLDVEKDKDYGKLSRLTKEQMLERAKEFEEDITNPDKKHELDITLWRASRENQPAHIPKFESPWGNGRPGWHIECSAMAIRSLGQQIDIHGGGIDLMYPHHESEISQSEGATGKKPFARFWVHTGTVGIDGEKMSKSLGNLILVSNLLENYSANAIRWVLLSHHYREPWQYNEDEFVKAQEYVTKIKHALTQTYNIETKQSSVLREGVLENLEDDLNTPAVLKQFSQAANKVLSSKNLPLQSQLRELYTLLGFTL